MSNVTLIPAIQLRLIALLFCIAAVPALAGPLAVGAQLSPSYDSLIQTDPNFSGPVDYSGALVYRDYGPYAVWLSEETLCPAVSVDWLIEHNYANTGSTPSFTEDTALPLNLQVDSDMYLQADTPNHGEFDRGHMTPRFDMDSQADELLSYYTTNICPQLSTLNGGNWRAIESQVRTTTAAQTTMPGDRALVFTGPIFTNPISVRIPTHSASFQPTVAVPDGFFKITAYCGQDFVVDSIQVNVWTQQYVKPSTYAEDTSVTTVAQIEALTGLLFRDIGTPTLSSYQPSPVPLSGGTITLIGDSINDATIVAINGTPVNFSVSGDDLDVEFPVGMSGQLVTVQVTTPYGQDTLQAMYDTGVIVPAPMIMDVQPMIVPVAGGTVRLSGLALAYVTNVSANSRGASYMVDGGDLVVTIPAGSSGANIALGVTSAGGADVVNIAYDTVAPRPIIRELIPAVMPAAGGNLRLRGDNLALVVNVEHDGAALTFHKEGADLIVEMPSRESAGDEVIAIFTAAQAVNLNVPYAAPLVGPRVGIPKPPGSSSTSSCALRVPGGKPLILIALLFGAAYWLRRRRIG